MRGSTRDLTRRLAVAAAIFGLGGAAALLGQPTASAQQGFNGRGSLKVCRATNNFGRTVTWGCAASQPCCFNAAANQGYCGPIGGQC